MYDPSQGVRLIKEMKRYSKSDVAKSQLDEAIKLFFEQRDPVSVHSLLGASHQIMRDIAKANDTKYRCIIEELISQSNQDLKQSYNAVFQPRNFFKHADKAHNVQFSFDDLENELWLLYACVLYRQVITEKSNAVSSFWSWYLLKYPKILSAVQIPYLVKLAESQSIDVNNYEYFRDICNG